jgi:hypothetical protein
MAEVRILFSQRLRNRLPFLVMIMVEKSGFQVFVGDAFKSQKNRKFPMSLI